MKFIILLCIIGAAVAVEPEQLVEHNPQGTVTSDAVGSQLGGLVNLAARDLQTPEPHKEKPEITHPVPISKPQVELATEKPEVGPPAQMIQYPFYPKPFYPSAYAFPYCNSEFPAPYYNYPSYHPDFFKFQQPNVRYPYTYPSSFTGGFFPPGSYLPENHYHPYAYPQFRSEQTPLVST